jgi:hypothetical protein
VAWVRQRRPMARIFIAMALLLSVAFAARWIFGPDTFGAIATLGVGLIALVLAFSWWDRRTGELVTPVEFHRRAAIETLATSLWQHVALFLIQINTSVIVTLAVTVERDLDGEDASSVAQMLLLALPVLIVLGVAVSLWGRRQAVSLLARTQAETA